MSQITYSNKVTLNAQPDIADINKVTADDMNEIKTAHNDTDSTVSQLQTDVSSLKNFDYCVATISSQQTASSDYTIQLDTISSTDNSMFSLSSGKIVIGSGVNTIKVSSAIFLQNMTVGDYCWGQIGVEGKFEATSIISFAQSMGFMTCVIPERIIEVEQGDILYIKADVPQGGTIRSGNHQTWVQIEKIN